MDVDRLRLLIALIDNVISGPNLMVTRRMAYKILQKKWSSQIEDGYSDNARTREHGNRAPFCNE
jgi:hypothetical protein